MSGNSTWAISRTRLGCCSAANHGTPGRIQGGSMIRMTGNLYLIKATDSTVHVERKAGGAA